MWYEQEQYSVILLLCLVLVPHRHGLLQLLVSHKSSLLFKIKQHNIKLHVKYNAI